MSSICTAPSVQFVCVRITAVTSAETYGMCTKNVVCSVWRFIYCTSRKNDEKTTMQTTELAASVASISVGFTHHQLKRCIIRFLTRTAATGVLCYDSTGNDLVVVVVDVQQASKRQQQTGGIIMNEQKLARREQTHTQTHTNDAVEEAERK